METILAICTILGGFSAVWFFWDKIIISYEDLLSSLSKNEEISLLSLPDDEFIFFDRISKLNFKVGYHPISEEEISFCNSLVNHGVFLKRQNSSFILTRAGKRLLNSVKST